MNAAAPEDLAYALERETVRRHFARVAAGYAGADVLARETANRMAERLHVMGIAPARVLDLGCGSGADFGHLEARYPDAQRVGVDLALPMLKAAQPARGWFARLFARNEPQLVCGEATRLPLANASVGLVWSNLMLHWLDDPLPALKEMHRALETGGLLMFATLGPDTLKELRRAFAHADAGVHVHRFIDMHDIGDALVHAGFAQPVMDMETVTLTYTEFDDLLRDLRATGATCAAAGRTRGLTGRGVWARVRLAYDMHRREGRLPASFEIVFGHAWKPAPRHTADGASIVQFDPKARRGAA